MDCGELADGGQLCALRSQPGCVRRTFPEKAKDAFK